MDVAEAGRLKTPEEENARLKRQLANTMLDNVALKDLLGKKWTPAEFAKTFPRRGKGLPDTIPPPLHPHSGAN